MIWIVLIIILFFVLMGFFVYRVGQNALEQRIAESNRKIGDNCYFPIANKKNAIPIAVALSFVMFFNFYPIRNSSIDQETNQNLVEYDQDNEEGEDTTVTEVNKDEVIEKRPIVIMAESVKPLFSTIMVRAAAVENVDNAISEEENIEKVEDVDGHIYELYEIKDELLLIPYKEDGYEVFFLGKISMNGNWDGKCLVNTYKDGELVFLNDIVYSDGIPNEYSQFSLKNGEVSFIKKDVLTATQVYQTNTDENGNKYIHIGSSKTYRYEKSNKIEQKILFDDPDEKMMYKIEDIKEYEEASLFKYYDGLSAQYEDDKGNKTIGACDFKGISVYVEFYEDGTVRMLYNGKFNKGKPNDDEGTSWEIVCDKKEEIDYMYNYGLFANGRYLYSESEQNGLAENNMQHLSKNMINEIVASLDFGDIDIRWNENCLSR